MIKHKIIINNMPQLPQFYTQKITIHYNLTKINFNLVNDEARKKKYIVLTLIILK